MKPIIFTLLVLALAVESFAQTLPSNPLDAKYSPAAGSVFDVNSKIVKTSSDLILRCFSGILLLYPTVGSWAHQPWQE
jgi:hypothetical protein